MKNTNGLVFTALYSTGGAGAGIGGFDLASTLDRAFAFDYDHSGKLDHIALYRAGAGVFFVLGRSTNNSSAFVTVFASFGGLGGYDLESYLDVGLAFDYDSTGHSDNVIMYRPSKGAIFIIQNVYGTFSADYKQGDPGSGIGGYDLHSEADLVFGFDYDHSGRADHLALYRPGTGTFWILKHISSYVCC